MEDKPEILKKAIAAEDWFCEKACNTCNAEFRVLARHVKYNSGYYVRCPSCENNTSFLEKEIPLSVRNPIFKEWIDKRADMDDKEREYEKIIRKREYVATVLIVFGLLLSFLMRDVHNANVSKITKTPILDAIRWYQRI